MTDETSGPEGGELSYDGVTWQTVSMDTSDTWSFIWNTADFPTGKYPLQMRGMDQAGNLGDPAQITLILDHGAPLVSLTKRWWIWESGTLKVTPNYFPIASVQVAISDLQNRWPKVVWDFEPEKVPNSISWNRQFADETLAPSGEYRVVAVACDTHDLCGSDTGIIAIPLVATTTATSTLSPTAILAMTPQIASTATQKAADSSPLFPVPSPEITSEQTQPTRSLPFWQLLGLLGLFLAIASTSVVDPRSSALDRLREAIRQMSNQDIINSSNNDE